MAENHKKSIKISHKHELLIWLIVVLFLVSLNTFTQIFKEKNDENDYQIFLQDVDGLIVGSPVRMMGIEVGHIKRIRHTSKEMYVKFVITNPDVYIPQGTRVNVEFSGMAGSKSLELYPPNIDTYIDENMPVISVLPPKRLHDAMGLLHEMYKKLNSIIYTTSSFGSKLNEIKDPRATIAPQNLNSLIDYSNKFIENTDKKTTELRPLWKKGAAHVK